MKLMSFGGKQLEKRYGKRTVLHDVSVHVDSGEIVGLLGPNGAGKTTTFSILVGIEHPDHGSVFLGDSDITSHPLYRRARAGVAYLPQESSVFDRLNVYDNLAMYLEQKKVPTRQQSEIIGLQMKEFGIYHLADIPAHKLSGGERRRLEVARALLLDPTFLLLDEPFAGIDPVAVEDLQQVVRRISRQGIGALITDHNVRETLKLVDRAYLIHEGEIFLEGTPATIAANEQARQLYLGEGFRLD